MQRRDLFSAAAFAGVAGAAVPHEAAIEQASDRSVEDVARAVDRLTAEIHGQRAYAELVAVLADDLAAPPLRALNVLSCGDHGWMECAAPRPCASEEDVEHFYYGATAIENYFQLTPQGKYWADLAFFTEFERPSSSKSAPSEFPNRIKWRWSGMKQ